MKTRNRFGHTGCKTVAQELFEVLRLPSPNDIGVGIGSKDSDDDGSGSDGNDDEDDDDGSSVGDGSMVVANFMQMHRERDYYSNSLSIRFDSIRIESNRIESDTPFRERNDAVAMTLLGLCEKGLGKDERHE
ncbi:hypothetical protein HZH68_015078 [Vespula germanica]|uniref:Uncharacterized protein n=1 Tax=Vespula germanica TaxID=30212 RepID=A0A834J7I5_VESGE|nr:hypothetical protein HZH68_015078 [Vespula germanica]